MGLGECWHYPTANLNYMLSQSNKTSETTPGVVLIVNGRRKLLQFATYFQAINQNLMKDY